MSIQDIGQYGETSESVIRSLILTALRSRSFVECKMLVYGMDAQHGPRSTCALQKARMLHTVYRPKCVNFGTKVAFVFW